MITNSNSNNNNSNNNDSSNSNSSNNNNNDDDNSSTFQPCDHAPAGTQATRGNEEPTRLGIQIHMYIYIYIYIYISESRLLGNPSSVGEIHPLPREACLSQILRNARLLVRGLAHALWGADEGGFTESPRCCASGVLDSSKVGTHKCWKQSVAK